VTGKEISRPINVPDKIGISYLPVGHKLAKLAKPEEK
jgi:hypothetical protein